MKFVDISDSSEIIRAIGNEKFDAIVNIAAESHVDNSILDGTPFAKSNILGTVNLLELVKREKADLFFQVSTDEVYGSITEGSWAEEAPLDPRSPYSASKASAELMCQAYSGTYGFDLIITRCANNFGPFQSTEKLIPKTIYNVLNNLKVPVYGTGQNRREWIFVEDHSSLLLKLLNSAKRKHKIYNIGGVEASNLQIVQKIIEILSSSADLVKFVEDRKGHDFRYSVDDNRLYSELGINNELDFERQLNETVDWYRRNTPWMERSNQRSFN